MFEEMLTLYSSRLSPASIYRYALTYGWELDPKTSNPLVVLGRPDSLRQIILPIWQPDAEDWEPMVREAILKVAYVERVDAKHAGRRLIEHDGRVRALLDLWSDLEPQRFAYRDANVDIIKVNGEEYKINVTMADYYRQPNPSDVISAAAEAAAAQRGVELTPYITGFGTLTPAVAYIDVLSFEKTKREIIEKYARGVN